MQTHSPYKSFSKGIDARDRDMGTRPLPRQGQAAARLLGEAHLRLFSMGYLPSGCWQPLAVQFKPFVQGSCAEHTPWDSSASLTVASSVGVARCRAKRLERSRQSSEAPAHMVLDEAHLSIVTVPMTRFSPRNVSLHRKCFE